MWLAGRELYRRLTPKNEVLVDTVERGCNPCREIRLPLYFRVLEAGDAETEHSAEIVSFGASSLVMRTPTRLKTSTTIVCLRIPIPLEMPGSGSQEMRGTGRVISELKLGDGTLGYLISIGYLETA